MLRIATFNMENLDISDDDYNPTLAERADVLRKNLLRFNADILCLQEIHGQELASHTSSHPARDLSALDSVVAGTDYENYNRVHTVTSDNVPYDKRNLVILSRFPVVEHRQYRNDKIDKLMYRKVTAQPAENEARELGWERPILYALVDHPQLGPLHIVNVHLKSRLASNVNGQKINNYTWSSASGWAEGYFLSSIKRVGQALETRALVDEIFDEDLDARLLVCGDFNSEPGEVPVEAICGRVENTGNPALRSRVLIPCSLSIAESVRFSHFHHGHGNLLDHVLMSQSLLSMLNKAEIHNENLHDESLPFSYDSKFPESDHAGFVVEFSAR